MRAFLFSTLVLLSYGLFGQTKDAYDHYVDSMRQCRTTEKVIPYFLKELKSHPDDENLYRWLGYFSISEGKYEDGKKYYEEAIKINPTCAPCHVNIGRSLGMQNKFDEAKPWIEAGIKLDPEVASFYVSRANLKESMGDKFGALFDYKKAIELEPANPAFYIERGQYHTRQGVTSLAIADFSKAILIDPKNYNPYWQRASIYYSELKYGEALKDMDKSIALDSTVVESYYGRASVYHALGELKLAIEDYSKIIQIDSENISAYQARAFEYYALEEMDAACEDLHRCYELIRLNEPNYADRKDIEFQLGNFCDSTKASYFYQRGIAAYNIGQYQKAVLCYERGLKQFPNNGMLLSFEGNALFEAKEYAKAESFYRSSLENESSYMNEVSINKAHLKAGEDLDKHLLDFRSSTYLSIAQSLGFLGKYEDALEAINTGIDLAPANAIISPMVFLNTRGAIYLALNQNNLAINDFDKCIAMDAKQPSVFLNRAVATVNQSSHMKMRGFTFQANLQNQSVRAEWEIPNKDILKEQINNLNLALIDCNKAISLAPTYAEAYFIRGQLKAMIGKEDPCFDFKEARDLGYTVDPSRFVGCK